MDKLTNGLKKNVFITDDGEELVTDKEPQDIFKWLDNLGDGSRGQVDKMRHIPTGKLCAVKKIWRSRHDDENSWLFTDLQILRKCHNENIVKCFGYFICDTHVWICLEPMITCFRKLLKERNKPLPEDFLGATAHSVVKALNYLKEEQQIIHRDVKTSNILINEFGVIKLADCGISGKRQDSTSPSRTSTRNAYMAPELMDSTCSTHDERADVWSLGVTLVEMATCQPPYACCENLWEVVLVVTEGEPPQLPEDTKFSKECRNFVETCLTKDYRRRPKYKQLIEHEFVLKHKDTIVKLTDLS